MHSARHKIIAAVLVVLAAGVIALVHAAEGRAPDAARAAQPLVWDKTERVIEPKPGETSADFDFTVTNVSEKAVTIEQIRPTCGCTVAEMPSSPWILPPHGSGTFSGQIDLRGKTGTETKAIFVNSTAGTQVLRLVIKIPEVDAAERKRNQALAQANRQAVFQGDCARCHLEPAIGRVGGDLFTAACGVCHFAPARASMVPDLLTAAQHRDAEYWRRWISEGKEGTLMPAWSKQHGGPLSDEQIESLVAFALRTLPTEPRRDR